MNAKELNRLRRQLRPVAESLQLTGPNLESFRRLLEKARHRPVHLVPFSLGPELIGVWVASKTADYIFYEANTTLYHQRHIVLHEGGHILRGHEGPSLPELVTSLCPHLDPHLIRSMLCHNLFNERQEAEAEVLATLIEEQMERATLPRVRQANARTLEEICRFFKETR